MKILVINDTTNWYHFGCTATSTALINNIKKLNHEVTAISILETYKIQSAPKTKNGFLEHATYTEFAIKNKQILNLVKHHEALIINGEGTLHGINQAPISLLYLAYITKTVLKKHVEILNHSAYPQHDTTLGNSEECAIYKLVYETLDFIAIREAASFNVMQKLGINVEQSFDCLPLYVRDYYQTHNVKKHSNTILIAGSATWLHLDIASNEKGDIGSFMHGLSEFSRYLKIMHSKGYKIKFLYGANEHPAKDDREFIEYMQTQFQIIWEIYQVTSVDDWLKTIQEATLLVSGRFHHTIAAITLGTKFIPLNSNTPKMEGLMQTIQYKGTVLQYTDHDIYNKLLSLSHTKLLKDEITATQINQTLNYLCNLAEKNFFMR